MRKAIYLAILLIVAASIAAPASCGGLAGPGKDIISVTGTVKFIELEGGFYGIAGDDGKNYDPINLAQDFRQDGMRVRFEAKVRTDMASTRQWGALVEITRISKLK
ncbi:MAG: hypothetical protein HW414_36 [Dehalococcoidia bacterium]|nr:hypothetical protein [Dehalococcoidia bacterium]